MTLVQKDGIASGPAAELRRARDDVEEAEAAVAAVSRARLAELESLPEQERIEHLEDPALAPPDRVALRRTIQANLGVTRSCKVEPRLARGRASRGLAAIARRWPALILPGLALLPAMVCIAVAWNNTATSMIATDRASLTWTMPDGSSRIMAIEAGRRFVFRRVTADLIEARVWIPAAGYATSRAHLDRTKGSN